MSLILTPIGAPLPASKENQYLVHLYFYLKRNIFVFFHGRKQRYCFTSVQTKLLCWDQKPWNLVFSHIFLATNLTQKQCQPRMRARLAHCHQQSYIRAMTDSSTNNSENLRFVTMANL